MRTLKFYGASDDLFEIVGTVRPEPDEIGVGESPVVVKIKSSGGEVCVVALYSPGDTACWSVGLMPVDEGVPIPPWAVSFKNHDNGSRSPGCGNLYSAEMTIVVPDDAVVSVVAREEDKE